MKYLTATLFMLLSFFATSVAMAQSESLSELAGPVLSAVTDGNYAYAAALALVLLVALVRRFGGAKYPFLASKKFAPVLVLVGSFGAAMAVTLGAGQALSLGMAWVAVKVAIGAAGGYSLAKPLLDFVQSKLPSWAWPLFSVFDAVFKSKTKAAEAAGKQAVLDNPSEGPDVAFRDIK